MWGHRSRADDRCGARALLALLAAALLCVGTSACGAGAGGPADSRSAPSAATGAGETGTQSVSSRAAGAGGYLKDDGDNDGDDPHATNPGQDDEVLFETYGHRASAPTERAITTLVEHYYKAALSENGVRTCALLAAGLTAGLISSQSQTTHSARTCAAAVAPLLAQQHRHLLAEDPTSMVFIGVYVKGDLGLAVLGFRAAPESDLVVEREGDTWKLAALLDSEVP